MAKNSLQHEWDLKSVDFPLTEDSVVFEIGGYEGRWAKEIAERYNPWLHIFEPQLWALEKCRNSLKDYYSKARLYSFGLGAESGIFPMGNWETDGCSFVNFPENKPRDMGILIDITFIPQMQVHHIDLCLMNIEGYEFKLIPYMIETGIMDKIDYFICQFHLLDSEKEKQYYEIRKQLGKMKKIRFDYGPILTCWEPR